MKAAASSRQENLSRSDRRTQEDAIEVQDGDASCQRGGGEVSTRVCKGAGSDGSSPGDQNYMDV